MKHAIFTILALMAFAIGAMAETNGAIVPLKGAAIKAEILRVTQQQVFYKLPEAKQVSAMSTGEVQRITVEDLDIRVKDKKFYDFGNKIDEPTEGVFYEKPNSEEILGKAQVTMIKYENDKQFKQELQNARQADPNYTIGRAMLCAGGVSLGVGVPCLITGSLLCVFSQKELTTDEKRSEETIKKAGEKRQAMATAGYMLGGAGIALSVVSIPLIIEGRKIVDLSLQLSENGAGVAVKF